jgi:phenylacetate-coenzyme A ligase PaaK-like adenylate-forming protein
MASSPLDLESLGRLRDARLSRTVERCVQAHPFYRRRFAELGLTASDIRTTDDLERLPLTRKADYMADPEQFRLHADDLVDASLEERTLWNVAYTTGTTSGQPSPFFNTTHDQYTIMLQARRCAEVEGLRHTDVMANLIPLPPMPTGGFLVVNRTAEAFGIPVMNALTGARNAEYPIHRGLDDAIDAVAATSPSVFWGIPSFMRRFFRRARERDIAFPRARMAITTGEPVSDALQREFFDQLRGFGCDDPQVRLRYSFTEMQGGMVQSHNGAILQHVTPDIYFLEVVDPDTGRRLPEGDEGALALTHLHRRGTVMLRYLVGDVVALKLETCPQSGVLGERLLQRPRRSDALVKVKGMLINPALIFEKLAEDRGIVEFQLAVRKQDAGDPDSPDVLEVRIEANATEHSRLSASLPDMVQKLVMVRPQIHFTGPGEIYEPTRSLKARRMIDERTGLKLPR